MRPRILFVVSPERADSLLQLVQALDHEARLGDTASLNDDSLTEFLPDLILLDLSDPAIIWDRILDRRQHEPRLRHCLILGINVPVENEAARQNFVDPGIDDLLPVGAAPFEVQARIRSLLRLGERLREADRQRENLARFVPEETLRLIAADTPLPTPGVHRDLAILFTDLRGFTQFASDYDPGEVFAVLSRSLKSQVTQVLHHGGSVDKIHGDGMLAYFEGTYRIERAIRCALAIQAQAQTEDDHGRTLTPPVGLALHGGPVLLGMLGAAQRLDHTIIGDAVNVCARLSGVAQPFQIVASESVAAVARGLPNIECITLGPVSLKGKPDPMLVFEIRVAETPISRRVVPSPAGSR